MQEIEVSAGQVQIIVEWAALINDEDSQVY
jgi:hypothetical protein